MARSRGRFRPHNLREVIDAVVRIIDNVNEDRDTSMEEVLSIIKGPDFPTGATILGNGEVALILDANALF